MYWEAVPGLGLPPGRAVGAAASGHMLKKRAGPASPAVTAVASWAYVQSASGKRGFAIDRGERFPVFHVAASRSVVRLGDPSQVSDITVIRCMRGVWR